VERRKRRKFEENVYSDGMWMHSAEDCGWAREGTGSRHAKPKTRFPCPIFLKETCFGLKDVN
jgi:hypothetical protein